MVGREKKSDVGQRVQEILYVKSVSAVRLVIHIWRTPFMSLSLLFEMSDPQKHKNKNLKNRVASKMKREVPTLH